MLKNIVVVYTVESIVFYGILYHVLHKWQRSSINTENDFSPFKSVLHMIYPTLMMHEKINSFFCGYLLMLKGTYTPYFQNLKFNIIFIFIYSILFLGADPHFSDSISLTPPFKPAFLWLAASYK